jgi:hypothetical protein
MHPNRDPMTELPSAPSAAPPSLGMEIHPEIRRSQEAFRRDLPQLLRDKKLYRRWVAYRGDERIGFAGSEDDLYEECARRGLQEHEYVVRCIVPEFPRDLDVTPAFDI